MLREDEGGGGALGAEGAGGGGAGAEGAGGGAAGAAGGADGMEKVGLDWTGASAGASGAAGGAAGALGALVAGAFASDLEMLLGFFFKSGLVSFVSFLDSFFVSFFESFFSFLVSFFSFLASFLSFLGSSLLDTLLLSLRDFLSSLGGGSALGSDARGLGVGAGAVVVVGLWGVGGFRTDPRADVG